MDQATNATVIASLTSASAFLAAIIAACVALWNENRKRRQERILARVASVRSCSAEVFKEIFNLQHEVEWLTWHAANNPQRVTGQMIDSYEAAVHETIPRLLGSLSVLASLDVNAYKKLNTIVDDVFTLEGQVARIAAGLGEPSTRSLAIDGLAGRLEESEKLWTTLPLSMAAMMEDSE